MISTRRLDKSFYSRDVLEVAPELIGKVLVRKYDDGTIFRSPIVEVEAYRGEEDLACHASRGRTERTEVMYHEGGLLYVYLIYGMYWMLNIVTGKENMPQAVLIRGLESINGPGRITKHLMIDQSFYATNLIQSEKIWIESNNILSDFITTRRIGIEYAGEWKDKPWRYVRKIE